MKKEEIRYWIQEYKRYTGKLPVFNNKKKTITIPARYSDRIDVFSLQIGIKFMKQIMGYND